MKLFLYDKFFEAFIKLNKGTQKKVLEFKKKFQENSKSAAILSKTQKLSPRNEL